MSFQFASPIDRGLPVTTFTNPAVGIRTDGSNVDVTVTVRSASIPQMDRRRLREAAIWVRVLAVPQCPRIQPVFVFRIGGWYFTAPIDLRDVSRAKRGALRHALVAAGSPATAGSWTIHFRLVDTATTKTAALRSTEVTKRVREEAASLLLQSLCKPSKTGKSGNVPLLSALPTCTDLIVVLRNSERMA